MPPIYYGSAPFALKRGSQALNLYYGSTLISGGGGTDEAVTAYSDAVTTAGSSLPAAHATALNNHIAALRASGAFALIKELWLPLGLNGDTVCAGVKLINGATSPTVTFSNIVAGDYTVATGLDFGVSNTNKKLTTDFQPSVNGSLTAGEWGLSAYLTRQMTTGALFGTAANTNTYLHYNGLQNRISNKTLTISGEWKTLRMVTAQITGGTHYGYWGGWAKHTGDGATPVAPTGALSLGSVNNTLFANAAVSGYAIHAPMTPAQIRSLQTFFDNVCMEIGRAVFTEHLIAVGDSYTAPTPQGPSSAANSYIALAATNFGWPYRLNGVSGRSWATGGSAADEMDGNGGLVGVTALMASVLQQPSKRVFFPMGLNDTNNGTTVDLGGPTGTDTVLINSMNTIFQILSDQGYPKEYLAIGTGYWANAVPNQSVGAAIAARQVTLASSLGIRCVDLYSGATNGVTAVETAGIHKNDAGHVLLSNDLISGFGPSSPMGQW